MSISGISGMGMPSYVNSITSQRAEKCVPVCRSERFVNMEIQGINSSVNIRNTQSKVNSVQNNEFKELLDKITGGDLAQEIRDTYDVTLNVGSIGNVMDFLNTHDIRCKNYVAISADTLSKMEENSALKKKVMSAIEEFCSPEAQAEINALAPPVKSAGMIVYPDGDALYWLEGYPNDFGDLKEKKVIVSETDILDVHSIYGSAMGADVMGNNMETAMQILGTAYKRKDM